MNIFGIAIIPASDLEALHSEIRSQNSLYGGLLERYKQLQTNYNGLVDTYGDTLDKIPELEQKVEVAEQNKRLGERNLQQQLARIYNTNDKLRTVGKLWTVFVAHYQKKPVGKVAPKERQEWNTEFERLMQQMGEAHVTKVTEYSQLPKTEKDNAEAASPLTGEVRG